MHLGSLVGALISYLDARTNGGRWLVRIEDIDPPREIAGAADAILRTLDSHGLHWDGDVLYQRHSRPEHDQAIASLLDSGQAYYCDCARKTLIAQGHQACYPGFCRSKNLTEGALRVRVDEHTVVCNDRWQPALAAHLMTTPGDFIIQRRDGLIAYQLAVVVDDAAQGITDVVRGVDLYVSTPRQMWLQQLLALPTPRYAHFPVVIGADGDKLSKQTGASAIDPAQPAANLARALQLIGMPASIEDIEPTPEALLHWAIAHYDPLALRGQQTLEQDTEDIG